MTQAELQIVIAELREQNELNRREHTLNRCEHRLNRQMHEHVLSELARMDERNRAQHELNRREHELNRRCYDEGMALCARLVAQSTAAMHAFARSVEGIDRRTASVEAKVDTSVEETRAQTQALLQLIDRMDRLDEGPSAN
ncbi:MAG TPA: hypothetical protein VK506_10405 [Conexibacter sp.]|nr:hypothetical protein [Conexibacter sp.]